MGGVLRGAAQRTGQGVGFALRCAREYGWSAPTALRRAVHLTSNGFEPVEALELGLLDPEQPQPDPCPFVSKAAMMSAQRHLNPLSWSRSLQDKGMFYYLASSFGLPVPEPFAIWFRDAPGWLPGGRSLESPRDWEAFFQSLPTTFVLKPSFGYHGIGVQVLTRSDGRLEGADRSYPDAMSLCNLMAESAFDAFVIQERLRSHQVLEGMSGTEYLQTVRIMTLVARDGSVDLLHGLLKVIVGHNRTDNYRGGSVGNLLCPIELDNGVLGAAVRGGGRNGAITSYGRHPETGHRIAGVELPHWSQASALAHNAATAFSQVRTIGWDIAITPHGAVLVEANPWWDPPNPLTGMPEVLDALRSA